MKLQGVLPDDIYSCAHGGLHSAAPDGFDVAAIVASPPSDPD